MKRIEVNKGDKFHMLTIIKELDLGIKPSGQSFRRFECKCQCGNIKSISLSDLRSGKIKSCGCYGKQILKKHGLYKHKLYARWVGIRDRCNNKNTKAYKNYGGRGIKCEWVTFPDFLKDMGNNFIDGYQLDRIDNNGNYNKENCRWISHKENNRNKRTNHLLEYDGITKTLVEWGEEFNFCPSRLNYYIKKGLSIKEMKDKGILD